MNWRLPAAALFTGLVVAGAWVWEGRSGLLLVLAGALAAAAWRLGAAGAGSAAIWRSEPAGAEGSPSWQEEALDAAPLAVILVAPRGLVAFANRAALAEFPALKTGEPLSFGLRNPVLLEAVAACRRDRAAHRTVLEERVPVARSYAVLAAPLGEDASGPRGRADAALFLHDISGERRIEAMRSDFVANASHELRTPLASILGFIETLQGPAKADAVAREKFLKIMETQGRRMARLVDDLLSLSRIELKEHLAPTGVVDLVPVLAETLDLLAGVAASSGVAADFARGDGPLLVIGDRDDLLRVFGNLVENAVKYGRAGGRVEVSVARRVAANEAAVSIRDFGPGIAPEHVPRLTERFYRVDTAQSRAEGGTGLGLAIVKHIVNRHRGRLEIESRVGEGACFTVILPGPRPS